MALLAAGALLLSACGGQDDSRPAAAGHEPGGGRGRTHDRARAHHRAFGASIGRRARFGLAKIGTFSQPVYVTQPPGDARRLFVVERTGRVRVVRGGRPLRRPFLSVRGRVSLGTEQGLLSLAFSPRFRHDRRAYFSYTDRAGRLRVVEARASLRHPDRIDRSTRRLVLSIPMPTPTHHGGHLVFGPDGYLWVGVGDGGGPGDPRRNGQDRSTLLGKILRIDPRRHGSSRYRSAPGNPWARARHKRREIAVVGVRNPWRFSFSPVSRALIVGDVGQEAWEELDYLPRGRIRGANLGWSAWEGPSRYHRSVRAPHARRPAFAYRHTRGRCSITAGPVMADPALTAMAGRVLFGDFCDGVLHSLRIRHGRAVGVRSEHVRVPLLASFGTDGSGRAYAVSLDGPVFRIVPR